MQEKQPIEYGIWACDTMIRTYWAEKLPPVGRFHYHQEVFLSGMHQIYRIVKDETYFTYIKDWVNSIIDEDGNINI